jgi:hypothetical protein
MTEHTWSNVASVPRAGPGSCFPGLENQNILPLHARLYQLERSEATRDARANDHIFAD